MGEVLLYIVLLEGSCGLTEVTLLTRGGRKDNSSHNDDDNRVAGPRLPNIETVTVSICLWHVGQSCSNLFASTAARESSPATR